MPGLLYVVVFREIIKVKHILIRIAGKRGSAADHRKMRGRCRTRQRHLISIRDLKERYRRGPAVVGHGQAILVFGSLGSVDVVGVDPFVLFPSLAAPSTAAPQRTDPSTVD